jgi:hypothetical protein
MTTPARCGVDQDDGFKDEAGPHGSALRRFIAQSRLGNLPSQLE